MNVIYFYQGIISQIEQYKRHYKNLLRHFTIKKFTNLVKVEFSFFFTLPKVYGYPYILGCGINNLCPLHCPLCPTGKGYAGRKKGNMDFVTLKKIIDQVGDYVYFATITNLGEPFLNPDLFRMISYASQKNIGTRISSNLSIPLKEDYFKELIKSGLEGIVVSLDGVSQRAYGRYRRGGKIQTVFKNLKLLIKTKKEMKSKYPEIQWQFLVSRYNEDEMEEAKKLAGKIGVDDLRFMVLSPGLHQLQPPSPEENKQFMKEWAPRKHPLFRHDFRKEFGYHCKCFWLWRGVEYQLDGGISPCAIWDKKEDDFGNLFQQNFSQIWNNEKYQAARSIFKKDKGRITERTKVACDRCRLFRKLK